jgi:hypothetical protein
MFHLKNKRNEAVKNQAKKEIKMLRLKRSIKMLKKININFPIRVIKRAITLMFLHQNNLLTSKINRLVTKRKRQRQENKKWQRQENKKFWKATRFSNSISRAF